MHVYTHATHTHSHTNTHIHTLTHTHTHTLTYTHIHTHAYTGTPIFIVKAYLPVIESFGFETDLRYTTQVRVCYSRACCVCMCVRATHVHGVMYRVCTCVRA